MLIRVDHRLQYGEGAGYGESRGVVEGKLQKFEKSANGGCKSLEAQQQ